LTTFLDAYALVALLTDEPAAEEVEQLLRGGHARVVVANLAEAIDISQRVRGLANVRSILEPLLSTRTIDVVGSTEAEAWSAASLRGRHYDRKTSALSLADCQLLAHAIDEAGSIATSDPPLARSARAEGVTVLALPDSSGRRP
jgi:uncharacterized protein with PIN domain